MIETRDNSKLTLDHMLDLAHDQAVRVLVGQPAGEQLMPVFLIMPGSGPAMVMGTPWGTDLEKDMSAYAIRLLLKRMSAVKYSFLCEAWTYNVHRDAYRKQRRYIPPSQHPDRIEIVMAHACDLAHEKMRIWKIVRGADGRVTALDQLPDPDADGPMAGRFGNLFKPEAEPD